MWQKPVIPTVIAEGGVRTGVQDKGHPHEIRVQIVILLQNLIQMLFSDNHYLSIARRMWFNLEREEVEDSWIAFPMITKCITLRRVEQFNISSNQEQFHGELDL